MLLKSIKIMILCTLPFMLMAEELSDEPMEGDFFIEWDLPECTSEQDKIEGCVKRSYHENEKPWYETLYTNGKKQGSRVYYENGNLKFDTPYTDGVKEGVEKWYYEHGSIEGEFPYKNDKAEGISKEYYYENGGLETEFLYKNGARDGITKVYMFNGKLLIAITYQEGKALSGICGNDKALSDEQLQSIANYYPLPRERIAQLCGMKLEVD